MGIKRELTPKQQKWIAGTSVVLLILLAAGICVVAGPPMVRFASQPEQFRQWVDSHGFWGKIAYGGMVLLQVIIAIIPGEPLEIAGGYAFGALEGTILCLLFATAGSLLVFFLVRRFGMRLAEVFFPREKLQSLGFLKTSSKRNLLFLIIFMIPGTPKDMLCYYAGMTDMKWPVWLLICSLGRIPSVITSTVGGNALGTERYGFAIGAFAVTLFISITGLAIYNRICKKQQDNP